MATTFVLAFAKTDDADAAVGEYSEAGYRIVRIGPTDRLQLQKESEPSIIWRSGAEADWTVIIATKDEVALGPEP